MKLFTGKRVGQSGRELTEAVFFSFFLHLLVLLAAVFLYLNVTPRTYVPPFYEVKLVGLLAEPSALPQTPSGGAAPALPKQEAKRAALKGKKAAHKERKAPAKKGALPELAGRKQKTIIPEETKPAETPQQSTSAPAGEAAPGGKGETVAVSTPQQDFKFGWYLAAVRDKIGQNWRPPPDAKDAKARVVFSINRSGWVGDVNLDAENSLGTFGFKQAAIRAIRSSNPFPPLPEDFSKQSLLFSVDLMEE